MPDQERETPQDLAGRLRGAAAGIDSSTHADRAAKLREGREAEERQAELDAAQECEVGLERQREIEREADSIAERSRDPGHSL